MAREMRDVACSKDRYMAARHSKESAEADRVGRMERIAVYRMRARMGLPLFDARSPARRDPS